MNFSVLTRLSGMGLKLAGCMSVLGGISIQRSLADEASTATAMRKGATRDIISDEALRQQAASTAKFEALMASKGKPVDKTAPSMENSLWMHSLILFDGEKFTIIPEGSILHLPKALQSKVVSKAQGDFTFWPNFLKRNVSWLAAKEVPLAMARGDSKVAQTVIAGIAGDPRALVAVYKGGPIMILEPDASSEEATKPISRPLAGGSQPGGRR
ncbi:MAG: hypothetical protein JWO08_716 [Verrucomicrobiaceae bacterium]|nr:hypothetical protein [Verrucomicrobiaceae bacterium]